MELKDLAPWIAIAFTLALSILVPLFTQIANNRHQRKTEKDKREYEESQKRFKAYEEFLLNVGGLVTAENRTSSEHLHNAGASLHLLYIYAPIEWRKDLRMLETYISNFQWELAEIIMERLCLAISDELKKN